jgi:hypothetical protein
VSKYLSKAVYREELSWLMVSEVSVFVGREGVAHRGAHRMAGRKQRGVFLCSGLSPFPPFLSLKHFSVQSS